MSSQPSTVQPKPSVFETIVKAIYLDYVLKVLGVIMFGLGFLSSWNSISVGHKVLMIFGVIAWFVGMRFAKIYK